jgi:hypothetical protein
LCDIRVITEKSKAAAHAKNHGTVVKEVDPISFTQAVMLPNVISYASAFGFFKLVR